MSEITKVSQITTADLVAYIRLYEVTEPEKNTLETLLGIAKSYVKKYTGVDDLDSNADFVIAVLVLVQDMWDNRTLYVDNSNINHVVESILSLHAVNLL